MTIHSKQLVPHGRFNAIEGYYDVRLLAEPGDGFVPFDDGAIFTHILEAFIKEYPHSDIRVGLVEHFGERRTMSAHGPGGKLQAAVTYDRFPQ